MTDLFGQLAVGQGQGIERAAQNTDATGAVGRPDASTRTWGGAPGSRLVTASRRENRRPRS